MLSVWNCLDRKIVTFDLNISNSNNTDKKNTWPCLRWVVQWVFVPNCFGYFKNSNSRPSCFLSSSLEFCWSPRPCQFMKVSQRIPPSKMSTTVEGIEAVLKLPQNPPKKRLPQRSMPSQRWTARWCTSWLNPTNRRLRAAIKYTWTGCEMGKKGPGDNGCTWQMGLTLCFIASHAWTAISGEASGPCLKPNWETCPPPNPMRSAIFRTVEFYLNKLGFVRSKHQLCTCVCVCVVCTLLCSTNDIIIRWLISSSSCIRFQGIYNVVIADWNSPGMRGFAYF